MTYAKPTMQTADASKAIQSGQSKPNTAFSDGGQVVRIETPLAYEADE